MEIIDISANCTSDVYNNIQEISILNIINPILKQLAQKFIYPMQAYHLKSNPELELLYSYHSCDFILISDKQIYNGIADEPASIFWSYLNGKI